MSRLITSLAILGLLSTVGVGQESRQPAPDGAATANQPRLTTTAQKRAWLRREVAKGLNGPRQVQTLQAHVDLIQPQQIDKLVNAFLAQQLPPADPAQLQQQVQFELARARALRQALEAEYAYWRNGNVGYAPVITWLPEGTQMGASAVISPDRRYVRTNVSPFFSSVGPVYSYNLNTGETRLMPQYSGGYPSPGWQSPNQSPWPPLGYGQSNIKPTETKPTQQKWGYDRLRDRR